MSNTMEDITENGIPDLTKPSKRGLIAMLRDPNLRPPGFGEFSFWRNDDGQYNCPMDLAAKQWGALERTAGHRAHSWADALGMKREDAMQLFVLGSHGSTADSIADALEKM